jgi:uncharacterized protein YfaP (DUF2135 family)
VDFPRVALRQAWWDTEREQLSIHAVGQNGEMDGTHTTFRIAQLGDPTTWDVLRSDGRGPPCGHPVVSSR